MDTFCKMFLAVLKNKNKKHTLCLTEKQVLVLYVCNKEQSWLKVSSK